MDCGEAVQHYEPRFWGMDPVFSARVKLNIIDVLTLQPHPTIAGEPIMAEILNDPSPIFLAEVYCIVNHPVQSVHVMGDVVSIQRKARMVKYEGVILYLMYYVCTYVCHVVDDGTGVISCTQWRQEPDSDKGLVIPELGQLVSIWGKVSEYKAEKQLAVTTIVEHSDPNAEPLHWLEVAHLKKTVYSRPFSLPPGLASGPHVGVSLKDSTKEAVLRFLNDSCSGRHFTLEQLSANPHLLSRCMESVGDNPSSDEVSTVIASVVQKLPDTGVVIPALGVGRQRDTLLYEVKISSSLKVFFNDFFFVQVFSAKKHLCPLILEYIQRKEKTTESEYLLASPWPPGLPSPSPGDGAKL